MTSADSVSVIRAWRQRNATGLSEGYEIVEGMAHDEAGRELRLVEAAAFRAARLGVSEDDVQEACERGSQAGAEAARSSSAAREMLAAIDEAMAAGIRGEALRQIVQQSRVPGDDHSRTSV